MPLGLGLMSEADFNRALQQIDDLKPQSGLSEISINVEAFSVSRGKPLENSL